jgi:hypothetical protein
MEASIRLENKFKDFEHFCEVLSHEVLTLHGLRKEIQHIEYIDGMSDVNRRIFIQTDKTEYALRTWNVYETDFYVFIDFTLFQLQTNGEYEAV